MTVESAELNPTLLNQNFLVTGASGFLGRHVSEHLAGAGARVRTLSRSPTGLLNVDEYHYKDLYDTQTIRRALDGVHVVIHLAARVHVMHDRSATPLEDFRRVNVDGTRAIAGLARESGVRDFVFASSVKVMGEVNTVPWTENDRPMPADTYGKSKLEAEEMLRTLCGDGMNVAAVRLPLVYGAGVKANMLGLFRLVDRGLPLPLGGVKNQRSLLYAGNAAAAFAGLAGRIQGFEIFMLSDGEDVSTSALVRRIGTALGRHVRLLPAPEALVKVASLLHFPHAESLGRRLFGSLTVDPSLIYRRLGGRLPYTLDQGLKHTAEWYRLQFSQTR